MVPTELSDRLEQLRAELAENARAWAIASSGATLEYALAAECGPCSVAYSAHMRRASAHCRAEFSRRMRDAELRTEIAALESGPAAVAAPVVLSGEQMAGMDDTHNFCGVAA